MIPYIINVALILAGCLAFYKVLLQKETFYRLNRYTLMICLLVAFSLPLLPVPHQWSFRKAETVSVQTDSPIITNELLKTEAVSEPAASTPVQETKTAAASNPFSVRQVLTWLIYLYWFGVIVFALNFLVQIAVLLWRAYTSPVIKDGQFRIVEVSGDKAPCSFGNNIFINPGKYDWETYNQILQHEKVHISQKHSLDILLAEVVLIFQWFNPFAWLYRKEVESNLEFLTDDCMVQHKEVEPSTYQLSLLKVSTPHFPLSLTTNYNQSLLKKRIAMMNAKKSNVHTAWKYFFLLPLLVLFAALLNDPVAYGQQRTAEYREKDKGDKDLDKMSRKMEQKGIETEGYWFATVKDNEISIQFKRDEDDHSMNNSSFPLSEFPDLPRGSTGTFRLTREAGTMEFKGKFDGDQGMGRYKFLPNEQFGNTMANELSEQLDDKDLMVFFFINVKRSYLDMLKEFGYTNIRKNDLIPLVALNIDRAYIRSIRESGFNVSLSKLIPFKSLGIDGAYISEIRGAGYPNISADKLITFKAQGIDRNYLEKVRSITEKEERLEADELKRSLKENARAEKENDKNYKENKKSHRQYAEDNDISDLVVTYKALKINDEFINSFKSVGWDNLSSRDVIPLKSLGITPDYVRGFQEMGYTDIKPSDIVPIKSLNITPAYMKSFQEVGYTDLAPSQAITFKSLNITPDWIKGFHAIGYTDIPISQLSALKSMGVTPSYITAMKEKGFSYRDLNRYITLKSVTQ